MSLPGQCSAGDFRNISDGWCLGITLSSIFFSLYSNPSLHHPSRTLFSPSPYAVRVPVGVPCLELVQGACHLHELTAYIAVRASKLNNRN